MNIYVTRRIPESGIKMLKDRFGDIEINELDRVLTYEELKEKVNGRDAVLSLLTDKVDDGILEAAGGNCKVFSNYAVGFNNIDVQAASARKIMVTNTPGVLDDATADMAIALLFSVARRIVEGDKFMRAWKFEGWAPMLMLGKQVMGRTLGILGAGRIGSNVARKMAKAFQMKILYTNLTVNGELEKETGARQVSLDDLCRESDFLSVHVDYSPTTHHLINADNLKLMKEDAVLINTARGPVVAEEALVEVLKAKKIFGAGLDVFEFEPRMVPGLEKLDNVVLAPHSASATIETRSKMAEIAAQNLIDVLEGRMPQFLVNKEAF